MKNSLWLPVLLLVTLCRIATAQSDITLSGQLDSAVRYSTNTDPTGGSRVALGAAPDGYGLWRIKGNEGLGSGLSAHFTLESQFQVASGAQVLAPASPLYGLFGREASAGVTFGNSTLDAGRLQSAGTAAGALVLADPVNGAGYYIETIWPGEYVGLRFPNALRYRYADNGISVSLMHAFGTQAGSFGNLSMNAVTLGYQAGPMKLMLAAQIVEDGKGNRMSTQTLGATYDVLPSITAHFALMNSNADRGFAGIPNTGIIAPLPPLASTETMHFYLAGLTWRATDAVTLRTACYSGSSDGGTFIPSTESGKILTCYGAAHYALSKRTRLIAGVDDNHWTGGYGGYWGSSAERQTGVNFHNGNDTRMNISLGIEHVF